MLTYIRCAKANFFTAAGYIFLFACILFVVAAVILVRYSVPLFVILGIVGFICFFVSMVLLAATDLGFATFHTYKRTVEAIDRRGIEYVKDNVMGDGYCGDVGVALALEDVRNAGD